MAVTASAWLLCFYTTWKWCIITCETRVKMSRVPQHINSMGRRFYYHSCWNVIDRDTHCRTQRISVWVINWRLHEDTISFRSCRYYSRGRNRNNDLLIGWVVALLLVVLDDDGNHNNIYDSAERDTTIYFRRNCHKLGRTNLQRLLCALTLYAHTRHTCTRSFRRRIVVLCVCVGGQSWHIVVNASVTVTRNSTLRYD